MFFVSRDKGRWISVAPEWVEVRETPQGPVSLKHDGKSIKFRPFSGQGFKTTALPVRHGRTRAEGFFRSEDPKYRKGLTQEEAERFLANHEDYGKDFVAIGEDGIPLDAGDWHTPMKRSEPYLTRSGDGHFCSLCDRQLGKQGIVTHVESKKHMAYLTEAERQHIATMSPGVGG